MKSTFFHIGVNVSMERDKKGRAPRISPRDGSIPFVPLPEHNDPDFQNLTYGDPWGRLGSFDTNDIAWFIESAVRTPSDWGYYVVAYFAIEDVYQKKNGLWNKPIQRDHKSRIDANFHESHGDPEYAVIVGDQTKSQLLFNRPLRISEQQDPYNDIKVILGMPSKRATGYWFKKWFDQQATRSLLKKVSSG